MTTEFKVGDLVRLRSKGRNPAPGIHEVVEIVQVRGRERLLKVRAGSTASERTVEERQLKRA